MKPGSRHNSRIILSTNEGMQVFYHDEIIYCKADGNYTRFHLAGIESAPIICQTLKKTEAQLDSDDFFRTGKSYLINLLHLKIYNRHTGIVILDNNEQVPVSRRNKKKFLNTCKKIE